MNRVIFIVHFQPPEKYPPVVNLCRYMASQKQPDCELHLLTTHPGRGKLLTPLDGVQVHRLGTWKPRSRWQRLIFYYLFNLRSFWLLLRRRPRHVLYFETLSAFGPWLYKKWINREARLYIHYHEYTSPEEYRNGMALNKWLHKKEKQLYPLADWVSHTNADRLEMFLKDNEGIKFSNPTLMPNYPPASWSERSWSVKKNEEQQIGFVYVGALSLQTMYTRHMAQFVAANAGKCYWHIFSDNHDKDALEFLQQLNAPNIEFRGSIPYDKLPEVLPAYDIGVIMYDGSTLNYRYNAPNKFFEYVNCGLNVWFAQDMLGLQSYINKEGRPWVHSVDFNNMQLPSLSDVRRNAEHGTVYTAESVYNKLWLHINSMS